MKETESWYLNHILLDRPKHQVILLGQYRSPMGFSGYVQGAYQSGFYESKALFSDPFPQRFDYNEVVKVQGRVLLNGKIAYEVWKGINPYIILETAVGSRKSAQPLDAPRKCKN